jgi:putative ABC transport system permease protein
MNLFKLSWKNIKHRPLSTFLSVLLLAFGVGIIVLLLSTSEQVEKQFTKNIRGIDMVVGAKGSPLQLILSSVYQIDAPTGNISLNEYQKLAKNPLVKKAIPLAYGDNYKGYRIVGTEASYIKHYNAKLAEGRNWKKATEVVLGYKVAELNGLTLGDSFSGSHGLTNDMDEHSDFKYQVVGILEPSGTVVDKLILSDISSVWQVHSSHSDGDTHHHEHSDEHHHEHKEEKEITAALIKFTSPMGNLTIPRMVNQNTSMQAALPAIEINRLFSLMGAGIETLRVLAFLIVFISGVSVFISLFQSLKERKSELALLRSMGASRVFLFGQLVIEGLIISVLGFIAGMLLGKLGVYATSNLISDEYSYELGLQWITLNEVYLFVAVLIIGFLAALLPSIQAYRLNISKTLANE